MYTNKRRKQAGMVLAAIMAAATLMTGCAEEEPSRDRYDCNYIRRNSSYFRNGGSSGNLKRQSGFRNRKCFDNRERRCAGGYGGGNHRNSSDRKHRIHGCRWKQHYLCRFGGRQPGSSYLDEDGNALTVTIQGTDGTVYVKGSSSSSYTVHCGKLCGNNWLIIA